MEFSTLLIAGIALLAVSGVSIYMLHRSWGDSLPRHMQLPSDETEYQRAAPRVSSEALFADDTDDEDDDAAAPDPEAPASSGQEPAEGLLLITHPLLRQVIQRSLDEGGPAQQYVVFDGEDMYILLELIQDPAERRTAAELIEKFQAGNYPNAWDIIDVAGTFGRLGRPW
jgi:hypothetical protein